MLQSGKKNSALKALTLYEGRSAGRNPAYLIYGFAISLLWPLLFAIPMVLGNDSFLLNMMLIDLMLLKDSRKPNFHWDSETELSRKLRVINVIAIVAGVFMLAGFSVSLILGQILEGSSVNGTIQSVAAVVCLLILFLTLLVDRLAVRRAARNLAGTE